MLVKTESAWILLEVESETKARDADDSVLYSKEQCVHIYIYRAYVGGYKCERERGVKRHPLD